MFVPFFPLRGDGAGACRPRPSAWRDGQRRSSSAWLLQRSPSSAHPGTLSIEHLRENLAALELHLGDTDV